MERTHARVVAAVALGVASAASAGVPVLIEDFNDNSLDASLWCVLETQPAVLGVDEANQRLQVSSPGNGGVDAQAVVRSCGWALDAGEDFRWSVDLHAADPGPVGGDVGVMAVCRFDAAAVPGGAAAFTGVIASLGRDRSGTYFGTARYVGGFPVEAHAVRPAPASESAFFSYHAATDTLTVGTDGYDGADALAFEGLRDAADASRAGVALGGYSLGEAPAFSGAAAWVDTLVVEAGTIVPECAADLDANGSVNVDDVQAFVVGFLGDDPVSDCDGSGSLTVDDVQCFVTAFLEGC